MNPVFTDKQIAELSTMEACCNRIEGWISSLESLGLNMADERTQNEFRRMCCERVREIQQAASAERIGQ